MNFYEEYCKIGNEPCFLYFAEPDIYDGVREMQLVGIYSIAEIEYMLTMLMDRKVCRRSASLSSGCVFSMAFDYTCNHFFGLPDILARTIVMADMFFCSPLAHMLESFRALHFRMVVALRNSEPLQILLDLIRSILKLLPDTEEYADLTGCARELHRRLEEMERTGRFHASSNFNVFDQAGQQAAKGISEMLSACSEESDFSFDEMRDRILFFNQAVVPYLFNREAGQVTPMLSDDGLIDAARVHLVGIRCSCLERLVGSGLLMSKTSAPLICKEYCFAKRDPEEDCCESGTGDMYQWQELYTMEDTY